MASSDCPILVWIIALNREYSKEEYDACHSIVQSAVSYTEIPYDPPNAESFRQVMTHLLPLLMMRHRRIPRAKWRDVVTSNGKHWIEQSPDGIPPEKYRHSMIGYDLAYQESLCGMAMVQGSQRKVVNIGFGVQHVSTRGTPVSTFAAAIAHKLTSLEQQLLGPELGDEVVLRRLCILLALKSAYVQAIGQPTSFDWARLEFDIPHQTVRGDGNLLQGWEFRVFRSSLGVARRNMLVEEHYQCVCAFFRGTKETTFVWHESAKELESWVQFINIDQMAKALPKLTA
ncbi:hypothetical protein K438DRAFT_1915090 [Mycena galopus ATCC 62051]|nr:hypothetical protein K438DRAFT_1915090 [Mycena galopus ATCC 62051]